MSIQDSRIIDAMYQYGGSFAKAIANAAKYADDDNYKKLQLSFPELWERYEKFVFINKDN